MSSEIIRKLKCSWLIWHKTVKKTGQAIYLTICTFPVTCLSKIHDMFLFNLTLKLMQVTFVDARKVLLHKVCDLQVQSLPLH